MNVTTGSLSRLKTVNVLLTSDKDASVNLLSVLSVSTACICWWPRAGMHMSVDWIYQYCAAVNHYNHHLMWALNDKTDWSDMHGMKIILGPTWGKTIQRHAWIYDKTGRTLPGLCDSSQKQSRSFDVGQYTALSDTTSSTTKLTGLSKFYGDEDLSPGVVWVVGALVSAEVWWLARTARTCQTSNLHMKWSR